MRLQAKSPVFYTSIRTRVWLFRTIAAMYVSWGEVKLVQVLCEQKTFFLRHQRCFEERLKINCRVSACFTAKAPATYLSPPSPSIPHALLPPKLNSMEICRMQFSRLRTVRAQSDRTTRTFSFVFIVLPRTARARYVLCVCVCVCIYTAFLWHS